ncbi:hypothetical protein E2C01_082342 [Portunus trituberculatus]|uniref:Uncharacterized protein n=1 Tax=Portunus trituberculatus TaxID=210409 RepID=A0A5B7IYU3_PORTR|nr:hypothetical protein [Portunus trituberculatus]
MMAEFGVPEICVGMTEASTTRNLSVPITLEAETQLSHNHKSLIDTKHSQHQTHLTDQCKVKIHHSLRIIGLAKAGSAEGMVTSDAPNAHYTVDILLVPGSCILPWTGSCCTPNSLNTFLVARQMSRCPKALEGLCAQQTHAKLESCGRERVKALL